MRWMVAPLTVLVAACGGHEATTVTRGPHIVSPTSISVGAGQTTAVHVTVDDEPVAATAYAIADSCIARVSATGLVTGVGSGVTTLRLQFVADGVPYAASIPVTVSEPAVLRLTFQSITAGSPAAPVDVHAVRGTVTVTANADPTTFATVELRLAGRAVETRPVPADAPVVYTVNTAARDASGAPLYPNGTQPLQLIGTRPAPAPGCVARTGTIVQELTLANP